MDKLSIETMELNDAELDIVTGGALPQLTTRSLSGVQPEFHSAFSRYVIGRFSTQPE
jgi:hypothetical protein